MSDKKTPNPNGKKGCKEHQQKILEVLETLDSEGFATEREYKIDTPKGRKPYRYADGVGSEDGKLKKIVQVGKTNKNGEPVSREREAKADIELATGITVDFYDYQNENKS